VRAGNQPWWQWKGIAPLVAYACEKWTWKETIINRLMVFERKILRKIFSPNYENGSWRIKTNQEQDKLIKYKDVMYFAKAQSWDGIVMLKECKKQE